MYECIGVDENLTETHKNNMMGTKPPRSLTGNSKENLRFFRECYICIYFELYAAWVISLRSLNFLSLARMYDALIHKLFFNSIGLPLNWSWQINDNYYLITNIPK